MDLREIKGLYSNEPPARPSAGWKLIDDQAERHTTFLQTTAWVRFLLIAGYLVALIYLLGISQLNVIEGQLWVLHLKAYLVIMVTSAGIWFIHRKLRNEVHIGVGLKRIKTRIPDESAIKAKIEIYQDQVLTGRCEGYLWIDSGTLYYRGLQTAFRINREDIPPLSMWPKKLKPDSDLPTDYQSLYIPSSTNNMVLKYKVFDPYSDYGTRREALLFYQSMNSWIDHMPEGSIESLLPPSDVHPDLIPDKKYRKEIDLTVGILWIASVLTIIGLTLAPAKTTTSLQYNQIASFFTFAGMIILGIMLFETNRELKIRSKIFSRENL